jgi:Brp/Blh family beta-carotene 15,15'-monooxygenase
VAILVFGLPHGTLDLQLIARTRAARTMTMTQIASIYLVLAGLSLAIWMIDPVLALAMFLAVATAHFSEDWSPGGPSFLAHGMALAILAAPTLLWRDEVSALFVAVAGDATARWLADILLAIAPVSLLVAAVALGAAWMEGRRSDALCGAATLAAMIILPPAFAFALFFCLFHSPRHFTEALRELSWNRSDRWSRVVVPLTTVGLVLAMMIGLSAARQDASSQIAAASFVTLAVLTIPHMLTPLIVAAWINGAKAPPLCPATPIAPT